MIPVDNEYENLATALLVEPVDQQIDRDQAEEETQVAKTRSARANDIAFMNRETVIGRIFDDHASWMCADQGRQTQPDRRVCQPIVHTLSMAITPAFILSSLAQWSSQLWLMGCAAFLHMNPFYNPLAIQVNLYSNCC